MRERDDSFEQIFNKVFPILMAIAFLLVISAVFVAVHFIRKFW